MRIAHVLVPLALLVACGEDAPADAPPANSNPAPAAKPAPANANPAPANANPAPAGGEMDVLAINKAREAHIGKEVTVTGFMLGTTKQGNPPTQLNVSVGATEDIASETVLCMAAPDDASFDGIKQKSTIKVKGTVAEKAFFSKAMLEGCTLVK